MDLKASLPLSRLFRAFRFTTVVNVRRYTLYDLTMKYLMTLGNVSKNGCNNGEFIHSLLVASHDFKKKYIKLRIDKPTGAVSAYEADELSSIQL